MGDGLDEMLLAARARVGQEIGGKYRLDALIGVGGTAAVYAATHRNGHRVAVKVSHRKVYASPALWARFLRESHLGNLLKHEGVVQVLDDDVTQDGAAYLVMELLQGASLRAIAAELPLDVAYVAAVGDAVLEVLAVAHEKGVVHRDVKPENIFLTDEGVLKLLDFGVARQLGPYGPAVTTSGAILGTPAFMAPEQVLGRGPQLGPPTDLWSVGATLFTLISGQHVHEGATTGEVFVSAATRPARPLASVAPSCPAAVCAVVDRALRREIEDRWADASAMRAALAEAYRASFGKAPDAKGLLGRMARELLPLVGGGRKTAAAEAGGAATEAATWSVPDDSLPASLPPRPPGPRASGYRDLPPTLRDDAPSSPDEAPRLVRFEPEADVGIAPTERAPQLAPPPRPRAASDSRPFLFQDSTLVSQGETAPKPAPRGRLGGALAVLGLAAASAALGFGMSRARTTLAMTGEAPATVAPARAPSPTPAARGGGEADVAYGEAFQLWLDGAPSRARSRFADVARLDPARADAHLYAAIVSAWVETSDREHFARARALRATLAEREASLLEALEPMMAEPAAPAEAGARLERWAGAREGDAIARLVLAQYHMRARRAERLLALAPRVGGAVSHWFEAAAHVQGGDTVAAAGALARCVDASPGAVDCLEWLAQLETNEGRCVEAEKTARKLIAADQEWPNGYRYLARAVMGQTHSAEATRAVLRQRWARLPAEARAEVEAADEFFLHVYDGQFEPARRDVARWRASVSGTAEAWRQSYPLQNELDLELELGESAAAAETAREFALASRAWLPDEQYDVQHAVGRALYFTGQLPRDEFSRQRKATAERMRGLSGFLALAGVAWFEAYVAGVKDARDAEEALRAEPVERPLVDPLYRAVHVDAQLGRAYLLGGRPDEARRELRDAARACGYAESIQQVRALLWLGDAEMQGGDREAACRAYSAVLARWGHDARSVTARAARQKSDAARCPK
ncbi:MAG TPA: protein kinase [Polyangiaceae bacterium]|nr:protein kinase [Polyangiaceae bacterium]